MDNFPTTSMIRMDEDIKVTKVGKWYIEINNLARLYFKDGKFEGSQIISVHPTPASGYIPYTDESFSVVLDKEGEWRVYVYDVEFTFVNSQVTKCRKYNNVPD